jgi:hypothetical protein
MKIVVPTSPSPRRLDDRTSDDITLDEVERIEGLVFARNQIAHGDGQVSLTLADVRSYAAVCLVVVRQTRVFLKH